MQKANNYYYSIQVGINALNEFRIAREALEVIASKMKYQNKQLSAVLEVLEVSEKNLELSLESLNEINVTEVEKQNIFWKKSYGYKLRETAVLSGLLHKNCNQPKTLI